MIIINVKIESIHTTNICQTDSVYKYNYYSDSLYILSI